MTTMTSTRPAESAAGGEAAGVWIRVSSGGQDERNQVPDVERHCRENGYRIARRYVLHDKSASKGEHEPDLARMLADMADGTIRVLVAWQSSRLDRQGTRRGYAILAAVAAAGGRVEITQEPEFGGDGFGDEIMTTVRMVNNRAYTRSLSQNVGIAFDRIRANGGIMANPPWGFVLTGQKYARKLAPSPVGRKYAPGIFERAARGDSLLTVARWLMDERVPVWADSHVEVGPLRPWWAKSVFRVVRNPAFMGQVHDRAGKFIHACEPVVDAATWQRANDTLTSASTRPGGPQAADPSLLSGVLRCLRCGDSPMYKLNSGNRRKDGTKRTHLYYRCFGRGHDRQGCGNMVPLEAADALMNQAMGGLGRPVTVRTLVPGRNYDAEIAAVGFKLRSLPAENLPEDEEDARRAELRAERNRLQALPAVADEWVELPTGETYGELWSRSTLPERRAWLKRAAFTVRAGKTAMVDWAAVEARAAENPDSAFMPFDWFTDGDVVLWFDWAGDDDGLGRGLP